MYKIETHEDHLLAKFEDGFDYPMVHIIIRHLTMMQRYPFTNDLWHIGKHRGDIRMGELETMVQEFQWLCPIDATRTKTAIVAERGLTQSILELWVNAARKKVPFEMKIFHHREKAEEWLGISRNQMA